MKIRPELSEKSLAALREWDEAETRKSIMRKADDLLDKLSDFLGVAEDFCDRAGSFFDRGDDVLALAEALVAKGYDTLDTVSGTEQEK